MSALLERVQERYIWVLGLGMTPCRLQGDGVFTLHPTLAIPGYGEPYDDLGQETGL